MARLFLCGDVMTGRGIDQALAHHVAPALWEPYVESAIEYVALAEAAHGPLPLPLGPSYVWGDLLETLAELDPDARIANLETAVTTSDDHWRGKTVHYRMHPGNVGCLRAAGIDVCVLANNHVLDWGREGLRETLGALRGAGIATAGAGANAEEAAAPAVVEAPGRGRVLVYAYGVPSSGIPAAWEAGAGRPGIALLPDLSPRSSARVTRDVARWRRTGDAVVVSMHWGGNWGYEIDRSERDFAHRLVAEGGVDIVHGHSSHHPRGIEVFEDRLILYGCGDLLDDYEGISGYEEYRSDLALACFADLEGGKGLSSLEMRAFRIRRFRLETASAADAEWLRDTLDRESAALGTRVRLDPPNRLGLEWLRGSPRASSSSRPVTGPT
jgi:poly-gamma-glutamate synthesis protein (capsule biosynthesis protein)